MISISDNNVKSRTGHITMGTINVTNFFNI